MHFTIKSTTYIYLAILLFLVPLPWFSAWLIAVVFHEFCHWSAVRLCGGEVFQLTVGLGSANMDCSVLPDGKRLVCVLSGPVGGFLLLFLGRWLPRVAICSWILSVYNLLPLLPLDGGRALRILIRQDVVFCRTQKLLLALMTIAAAYFMFSLHFGTLPLVIVGVLWHKNRKRPCK